MNWIGCFVLVAFLGLPIFLCMTEATSLVHGIWIPWKVKGQAMNEQNQRRTVLGWGVPYTKPDTILWYARKKGEKERD